jgi:AraC-like DNA-binding protein
MKRKGKWLMKVKFETTPDYNSYFGDTPKDIVKAFRSAMFEQREKLDNTIHYQLESRMFHCIRKGEVDELKNIYSEFTLNDRSVGYLSKDPLRQAQYTFVAGITLATRSAIEGGLPEIEAYNLSDVYVQNADQCKRPEDVMTLFIRAIYDFTRRVGQVKTHLKPYSYPVTLCLEYILSHLHYQITLNDLAERCHLTPQYLSALFRKETGTTITEYILKEKLETAKQMLTYSELNLSEISQYLAFCSHSNFTAHFRKCYRVTPSEYREKSRIYNQKE